MKFAIFVSLSISTSVYAESYQSRIILNEIYKITEEQTKQLPCGRKVAPCANELSHKPSWQKLVEQSEKITGIAIPQLNPNSALGKLGMKSGDIILSLQGRPVDLEADFYNQLNGLKIHEEVEIDFLSKDFEGGGELQKIIVGAKMGQYAATSSGSFGNDWKIKVDGKKELNVIIDKAQSAIAGWILGGQPTSGGVKDIEVPNLRRGEESKKNLDSDDSLNDQEREEREKEEREKEEREKEEREKEEREKEEREKEEEEKAREEEEEEEKEEEEDDCNEDCEDGDDGVVDLEDDFLSDPFGENSEVKGGGEVHFTVKYKSLQWTTPKDFSDPGDPRVEISTPSTFIPINPMDSLINPNRIRDSKANEGFSAKSNIDALINPARNKIGGKP